jgi:glycosyltransferase involved in cell wall biosynthesis
MCRLKVGIVHPRLGSGGSEARALWALQALKRDYDVTLITAGEVDVGRLNQYYGTRLSPQEFSIREVPMPLGLQGTSKFAGLRGAFFQRYLKRVSREFDVMISAYNPCNFGVPGIQCIADFSFIPEWRFALHPALQDHKRWWYADSPLRRAYLGLCNLISTSDSPRFEQDIVVANSNWSAARLRERLGIEARMLYPPVAGDFPTAPDEEKENGFVCLGRVVPEKRVAEMIQILEKVRRRGRDIHLHILGAFEGREHERELRKVIGNRREWVFFEGTVFGQKKKDLLARHRFGIHGCKSEAFGIAVAEMVKAGCIVFVPDGGGQTEIANHPDLLYPDDEAAVEQIDAVLRNPGKQKVLRQHLQDGAWRFSTDIFQQGILDLTREFLARQGVPEASRA